MRMAKVHRKIRVSGERRITMTEPKINVNIESEINLIYRTVNVLLGLELLEMEDESYLIGDAKGRSEEKIKLLKTVKRITFSLQKYLDDFQSLEKQMEEIESIEG